MQWGELGGYKPQLREEIGCVSPEPPWMMSFPALRFTFSMGISYAKAEQIQLLPSAEKHQE